MPEASGSPHPNMPEETRRTALAHPVAHLGASYLHLRCGCARPRVVLVAKLRRPPAELLGATLARMRCQVCRQPPRECRVSLSAEARDDGWWIRLRGKAGD